MSLKDEVLWKDELLMELDILQDNVNERKYDIENGVDEMEEGKNARDEKKRKILLNEMKNVLAKLNEVDKEILKDFKGEAFDFLRTLRKINNEIDILKSSLKSASVRATRIGEQSLMLSKPK